MKQKTEKSLNEQRRIVAYLDSVQARLASLPLAAKRLGDFVRELQSQTGEELRRRRTLLPSVLDKVFRGEL